MKVFLCESIHPKALELLKSRAEIVSDWDDLSGVHAIINRNLKLPREVLEQAPELKVIAVHGTGSDGIDLEYCKKAGIPVTTAPNANSRSVAEHAAALMVALAIAVGIVLVTAFTTSFFSKKKRAATKHKH